MLCRLKKKFNKKNLKGAQKGAQYFGKRLYVCVYMHVYYCCLKWLRTAQNQMGVAHVILACSSDQNIENTWMQCSSWPLQITPQS